MIRIARSGYVWEVDDGTLYGGGAQNRELLARTSLCSGRTASSR